MSILFQPVDLIFNLIISIRLSIGIGPTITIIIYRHCHQYDRILHNSNHEQTHRSRVLLIITITIIIIYRHCHHHAQILIDILNSPMEAVCCWDDDHRVATDESCSAPIPLSMKITMKIIQIIIYLASLQKLMFCLHRAVAEEDWAHPRELVLTHLFFSWWFPHNVDIFYNDDCIVKIVLKLKEHIQGTWL